MLVHSRKLSDSAMNEAMFYRKLVYQKDSEWQGLEENTVDLEGVPILSYGMLRKLCGKSHSCVEGLHFSYDITVLF